MGQLFERKGSQLDNGNGGHRSQHAPLKVDLGVFKADAPEAQVLRDFDVSGIASFRHHTDMSNEQIPDLIFDRVQRNQMNEVLGYIQCSVVCQQGSPGQKRPQSF